MKKHKENERTNDPAKNPDPITKAPGSHPLGTGVGAAAGGLAGVAGAAAIGAAAGTVVGPVGTAIGAAAGAIAGGLAGKGVAEQVNPTEEENYWRENYRTRPYVDSSSQYDEYGPAYRYGWESRGKYADRRFDDVESELGQNWERVKGQSKLNWERAKQASRDAWDRVGSDRRND